MLLCSGLVNSIGMRQLVRVLSPAGHRCVCLCLGWDQRCGANSVNVCVCDSRPGAGVPWLLHDAHPHSGHHTPDWPGHLPPRLILS